MEDVAGYLVNAHVVLRGKRKAIDTVVQSFVETDPRLLGKEGELTGFFGIYAGGARSANIVEAHLRAHLTSSPRYQSSSALSQELRASLQQALMKTQADIYSDWEQTKNYQGVHTTAVLLRNGNVIAANAGGGGAVICRADGYVGMLTEKCLRLDQAELVSVQQYCLDCEDESIIIGCPSFWEALECSQAVRIARDALRKYKDVKYTVQKLAMAAQNAGAPGNIAVAVVLLNAACAFGEQDHPDKHSLLFSSKLSQISSLSNSDLLSEAGSDGSLASSLLSARGKGKSNLFFLKKKTEAPAVFIGKRS